MTDTSSPLQSSLQPTSLQAAVPPTELKASGALPSLGARERIVDLLQLRFADDCLSMDEFERRVASAYQARTVGELDTLVADLAPAESSSPTPEYGRIVTILSNNERNGAMPVPRRLEIVAVLGNVELDLSDAVFSPGISEIDISAVFGNVEIKVPLGVRVESAGNAFLGNFDHKADTIIGYPNDGERTLRIRGHAVFSSVEIGSAAPRSPFQATTSHRLK